MARPSKLETPQRELQETRNKLADSQANLAYSLSERRLLNAEVDRLTKEIAQKDKMINALNDRVYHASVDLSRQHKVSAGLLLMLENNGAKGIVYGPTPLAP